MSQKNVMFNRLANDINEYLSNLRNQYEKDYSLDIQEFTIKNDYNDNGEICSLTVKTADYTATVNASIDIKYKLNKSTKAAPDLPVSSSMTNLFEGITEPAVVIDPAPITPKEEKIQGIYESDSAINKKQGFSKRIIKNMQSILNDLKNKTKTYDEICTAYNVSKKSLNKILTAYSIPSIESDDSNKAQEESKESDDDEDSHLSSEDVEEIIESPIYESNPNLTAAALNISIEDRARILEMIINNIATDEICRIMSISQEIVTSITALHKTFITRRKIEDDVIGTLVATEAPVQTTSLDERIMACSSKSIQDASTDEDLVSFQKYLNTSKPFIRR